MASSSSINMTVNSIVPSLQPKKWISGTLVLVRAIVGILLVLINPPNYYFLHCTRDPNGSGATFCTDDFYNDDAICKDLCSLTNGEMCAEWQERVIPILVGLVLTLFVEIILILWFDNPVGSVHAHFLNNAYAKGGNLHTVPLSSFAIVLGIIFVESAIMMGGYFYFVSLPVFYCASPDTSVTWLCWSVIIILDVLPYRALHYLSEKRFCSGFLSLFRFDLLFVYIYFILTGILGRIYRSVVLMFNMIYRHSITVIRQIYPDFAKEVVYPAPSDESMVKYDVFLTHDWGTDEFMRNNHSRVSRVNRLLKEKGLVTWFDEDRMEGDIRYKMTEGIENSKVIVVFITERYLGKVSGSDPRDNCNFEFWHSFDLVGLDRMIPVVMEARMRDPTKWRGKGGAALRGRLYIDMVDDGDAFFENADGLYSRITKILESDV